MTKSQIFMLLRNINSHFSIVPHYLTQVLNVQKCIFQILVAYFSGQPWANSDFLCMRVLSPSEIFFHPFLYKMKVLYCQVHLLYDRQYYMNSTCHCSSLIFLKQTAKLLCLMSILGDCIQAICTRSQDCWRSRLGPNLYHWRLEAEHATNQATEANTSQGECAASSLAQEHPTEMVLEWNNSSKTPQLFSDPVSDTSPQNET